MLKKMPILLIICLLLVIILNPIIPIEVKKIMYSLALTIKSLILFVLPYTVFCMMFRSCFSISEGATQLMLYTLIFVCISNLVSSIFGISMGYLVYNMDISINKNNIASSLSPMWNIEFPEFISTAKALFLGVFSGIISKKFFQSQMQKTADYMEKGVKIVLNSIIYCIPLFVTGFFIKLYNDGTIQTILNNYLSIFVIMIGSYIFYLFIFNFILNRFNVRNTLSDIKNVLPAAISGFSTTSSASCMPLTILCVSNNIKKKHFAECLVPATVNIHMIGDSIAIPILAFAILKTYGIPFPYFHVLLMFLVQFSIARFSVVAIPGGSIFILIGILEKYFGFTSDMSAIISALYMLADPFLTATNILGNTAFTKMMDRIMK